MFGANDLAGFIDELVMGPAKTASSKIMLPTAIPAIIPTSLLPVEILIMTTIKKKANNISMTKARPRSIEGIVEPNNLLSGNNHINNKLAAKAPPT